MKKERAKEIAEQSYKLLQQLFLDKETFIEAVTKEVEYHDFYETMDNDAVGPMVLPRYIAQAVLNNEYSKERFIRFGNVAKHKKNVKSLETDLFYTINNLK